MHDLPELLIIPTNKDIFMKIEVFKKLHDAQALERDVTLTAAEVEVLYALMEDAFAQAEKELEKWEEIFEDYQLNNSLGEAGPQ